jgi:hypothetical protein
MACSFLSRRGGRALAATGTNDNRGRNTHRPQPPAFGQAGGNHRIGAGLVDLEAGEGGGFRKKTARSIAM